MTRLVMGSETEFGVATRSEEWDESSDKDRIRAFVDKLRNVLSPESNFTDDVEEIEESANWWDEDLTVKDAPDEERTAEQKSVRRLGISGERAKNGARLYVDGSHPEHSTPECFSPYNLVAYERAGEEMMREIVDKIEDRLGVKIDLLKRNWNPKSDVSYACHENYLLSRSLFDKLTKDGRSLSKEQLIWMSHLITRQIYTGSGRLDVSDLSPKLTLSQRQPFIENRFEFATTHDRALINLRDRAYADPSRFARLHVITGDSNRADWSNFLKYGVSALVLMMLEDLDDFDIENEYLLPIYPVTSFRRVRNKDSVVATEAGSATVAEVQTCLMNAVAKWYGWRVRNDRPIDWAGGVIKSWGRIVRMIKNDDKRLSRMIDYYIKRKLYGQRIDDGATPKALRSLDHNYHLVGEGSFFDALVENGMVETLIPQSKVDHAKRVPPKTRAYLRQALLSEFGSQVAWQSWHTVDVTVDGRRGSIRLPSPASMEEFITNPFIVERVEDIVSSMKGGSA